MGSAALFGVASRIVDAVDASEAKRVLDWYLDRLVARLPADDRDALAPVDVPATMTEALSRFLYAFMSDIDTRVRWRTAHVVRFMAHLEDAEAITGLLAQYGRLSDQAFRDPKSPFYDLGARLWVTMTACRMSEENPRVLAGSTDVLLQAALSADLPHVVIREYAKRALQKAFESGAISLSPAQQHALAEVNRPRQLSEQEAQHRSFSWSKDRAARRFSFDEMDTLPYWYSDLLNIFPQMPGDQILEMAERWILDVWQAPVDVNKWVMEPRRDTRLSDRGYDLWSHRHGSLPTVERYSTYLEWHAMLCTAGELLALSPVGPREYGEDRFQSWLAHFLPTQPPLWLSDLRGPTPLSPNLWWQDSRSDAGWFRNCRNDEYLAALGLPDGVSEGWIVVEASVSSDHPTREERCHINSALVSPATAAALTRALQSVRDPWDFRIPPEGGDDLQFDQSPYRLTGWLASWNGDSRFDSHDPLRFDVRAVQSRPGRRVSELFELERHYSPSIQWTGKGRSEPSFIYESWSDEAPVEHQSERVTKSEGWRLLARIDDLEEFLTETGDDLICEITIERRLRSPYSRSYEPDAKQRSTSKSSSSRGTAPSATSEEILAFGKRLVAEYRLEPGVDTLGKWMAHHIAELINDAENATGADRSSKVTSAIEAILVFWDHRDTVDSIDPLRDLKPILRVIKTLDPEENRWGIYFRRDGYGAVAEVYSAFREIVIFGILRQSKHDIDLTKMSAFVSDEERAIIESLGLRIADYQKEALESTPKRGKAPAKGKLDTKALVLKKIENARLALDALVDEINGKPRASLTTISDLLLRRLVGEEAVAAAEIEIIGGDDEDGNSTV